VTDHVSRPTTVLWSLYPYLNRICMPLYLDIMYRDRDMTTLVYKLCYGQWPPFRHNVQRMAASYWL